MLSKLVCAAALTAGAVVQGHSIQTRDAGSLYRQTGVNRDGGGGGGSHAHGSSAGGSSGGSASGGYGSPQAPSYSAPASGGQSYQAPAPSYGAPEPSYSAPAAPSYGAPEVSYGAPSTGYGEEAGGGLDLTSILIPLLALVGLSLLFPTFVSLSGRKKRSALEGDGDVQDSNPMGDIVERVNDIYMSVIESEECMERIACEIGGLADDVGLKENSIAKMASPFVPTNYKKYFKQFQSGKDCASIKCGTFSY